MPTHRARLGIAIAAVGLLAAASGGVAAFGDGNGGSRFVQERLTGYQEDPLTVSTTGTGRFRAWVDAGDEEIRFALSYSSLEGAVTQAHIHFGGRHQSGGISVWLCGNPSATVTPPAGTPTCPAAPATVTGTLTPDNVVGPVPQGIAAGEFDELVAAMRADTTYVNVHSSLYPGGEIRSQLDLHAHHG